MAGPITWRNVGGGGMNPAAFLGGGDPMAAGMESLMRTMQQYTKDDAANLALQKENNANAYLDEVAGYTREQLQDPAIRAELDAKRVAQGAMMGNRDVVRDAIDQRVSALQDAAVATQKFDDVQAEVKNRPLVEKLAELKLKGDKAGYNKILDENSFPDEAKLRDAYFQQEDANLSRTYNANSEQRSQAQEGRSQRAEARTIDQFNYDRRKSQWMWDKDKTNQEHTEGEWANKAVDEFSNAQIEDLTNEAAKKNKGNILAGAPSKDPLADMTAVMKDAGLANGKLDAWLDSNKDSRQGAYAAGISLNQDGIPVRMADGTVEKVTIPAEAIKQYLQTVDGTSYISSDPGKMMIKHFTDLLSTPNEKGEYRIANEAVAGIRANREAIEIQKTIKKAAADFKVNNNADAKQYMIDLQKQLDTIREKNKKVTPARVAGPEAGPPRPTAFDQVRVQNRLEGTPVEDDAVSKIRGVLPAWEEELKRKKDPRFFGMD